jgi:rhodanese-related sulfurtransferase
MKRNTDYFSLRLGQAIGSLSFALFLSLGLIVTACNSGSSQNDKEEQNHVEEEAAASYHNIDVAKFDKLRESKDYVVLDVRTPKEIAAGKVADAIELDYFGSSFDDELGKLDKAKQYLVYCKVGGRSSKAAQKMIDMGFVHVFNLNGGYDSWSAAHPSDN